MFRKKEILYLAITIFVVSLAIGFDDGSPSFSWSYWLQNFVIVFLMVAFSFLVQQIGHKIAARMNGFDTEYTLWGFQDLSLRPMSLMGRTKNKMFPRSYRLFGKEFVVDSFPVGIVLSLLVTLMSNGKLFFLAVGQYHLILERSSRFGRKALQITNYEEAKIALAGPMMNIVLLVLATLFNSHGSFDTFILLNALLAFFHMLPLPYLAGLKIYFGSRLLYVSSLVFMISIVILAYTVSTIPMLLISLASLLISGSLYYYYSYFK